MKIVIDVSPLKKDHFLQHRVRGTGFYIENLKKSLLKYFPEHQYNFYTQGENLPKDTDIIHVPYFEPFFLTLPFIKKFKTIVTVHDLTPLVFPQYFPCGIKGKLKWELQRLLLKRADVIITDSQSSKKDIIKNTGISDDKVHIVYLAAGEEFKKVQSSKFKVQSLLSKYNLPDKFILYVGDVTWNKNLPRLLEAIKKLDIPLIMVGKALTQKDFDKSNPWNKDLIKVQQMVKGNKKILCLGFVPTEDLVMLYNIATIFVMPSLYEGFGLPLLEAMSCGCPVVTSREGSIPEVAGEAAHYVNAYSLDDIVKGIDEVFNNSKLRENLAKKGLERASDFTWKKTAEETMQVYKKL